MRLFGLIGRPNIGELKSKGDTEELIKALQFPDDPNVRFEAASALGNIGDPEFVEPLIQALDDNKRIKEVAIRSLGRIGDSQAVEPLEEALQDEDWEIRSMAAKSLGQIEDPRATPALIHALENETKTVSWYISQALTNITGQSFGQNSDEWQEWYKKNKEKR
jgi:HEAT repeat protein